MFAAVGIRRSAGGADADSQSAKTAWKKISGGCPVTALPGSVRIVVTKTDMEISRGEIPPRRLSREAADTTSSVRADGADTTFISAYRSILEP